MKYPNLSLKITELPIDPHFLTTYGNKINSLTLTAYGISYDSAVSPTALDLKREELKAILLNHCPNLKAFALVGFIPEFYSKGFLARDDRDNVGGGKTTTGIQQIEVHGTNMFNDNQLMLTDLFTICPKLEVLRCGNKKTIQILVNLKMLSQLIEIEVFGTDMLCILEENSADLQRLQKLEISIQGFNSRVVGQFHSLMSSQSRTLGSLMISVSKCLSESYNEHLLYFPCMTNLKSVEFKFEHNVKARWRKANYVEINVIANIAEFPSLQELFLSGTITISSDKLCDNQELVDAVIVFRKSFHQDLEDIFEISDSSSLLEFFRKLKEMTGGWVRFAELVTGTGKKK